MAPRWSSPSSSAIEIVSSDLQLLVFDPARGAIVAARWLGGRQTVEAARRVLGRPARAVRAGLECWSGVAPAEVEQIAQASHVGGATSEEIVAWARRLPVPSFVWLIDHDF